MVIYILTVFGHRHKWMHSAQTSPILLLAHYKSSNGRVVVTSCDTMVESADIHPGSLMHKEVIDGQVSFSYRRASNPK